MGPLFLGLVAGDHVVRTGPCPDKSRGGDLIGVAIAGDGTTTFFRQKQDFLCGVGMDMFIPEILSRENMGDKCGIIGIAFAGK